MIPQTLHVIGGFLAHVFEKRFIGRIQTASEHEILPDENPHLVTKFIKIITLVNSTAPNPEHIHVSVTRGLNQFAIFIFCDAAGKTIGWNPVAAFGKDRHAFNHEGEAFTGVVTLSPELQATQTSASTGLDRKSVVEGKRVGSVVL